MVRLIFSAMVLGVLAMGASEACAGSLCKVLGVDTLERDSKGADIFGRTAAADPESRSRSSATPASYSPGNAASRGGSCSAPTFSQCSTPVFSKCGQSGNGAGSSSGSRSSKSGSSKTRDAAKVSVKVSVVIEAVGDADVNVNVDVFVSTAGNRRASRCEL